MVVLHEVTLHVSYHNNVDPVGTGNRTTDDGASGQDCIEVIA